MALNIFRSGTMFYILDTVTDVLSAGHAKNVLACQLKDDEPIFQIKNLNNWSPVRKINVTEAFEADGTTAYTLASFKTFIESETGYTEEPV
jgi:hypothetical protein